ncbi:hypothetical protein QFC22_004885 [Naganishia vaughanmartiniae]|uniref:Uncharacterized protein n=1 Tax=Naganishia vaughanmartiniae TaxID=1424756 RepID=A0ACC2WY60_9TREE|nr:hypothetical protein QFC22_004885 [Naganishia vaughanmartiniae]
MSLFAGTSFLAGSNDKKPSPGQESVGNPSAALTIPGYTPQEQTSGTSRPSCPLTMLIYANKPDEPAGKATTAATSSGTGQAAWSAALRFAPAAASRRKPAAKPPTAGFVPVRIATTSASFSAAPSITAAPVIHHSTTLANTSTASAIPGLYPNPGPSSISQADNSNNEPSADQTPDGNGKKIFRPPAMTLDVSQGQSQNDAFSNATGGRKRGAPGAGPGGPNKKKKWKKNKKQFEMPQHIFIPDEPYNPAKPNDLQEYQDYRKAKREERKARAQAERDEDRRRREGSEKSYYSEDEEDDYSEEEAPRRDAPRAFAPPSSLYASQPDSATQSMQPPVPFSAGISAEETQQRAPQGFTAPSISGSAYHPIFQPQTVPPPSAPPVAIRRSETADEVYARRLAMSTGVAPVTQFQPPPSSSLSTHAPSFVKSAVPQGAPYGFVKSVQSVDSSASTVKLPAAFVQTTSVVDLSESDSPPPPLPPPASAPVAPMQGDTFQKALETRRLAAEAIAKRLAATFPAPVETGPGIGEYVGSSSGNPVVVQPEVLDTSGMDAVDVVDLLARQVEQGVNGGAPAEQGSFAERMMRKMGHVEGQGLGRAGGGIVHALAAEHADKGANKKNKGGWVQSTSAKGRLVNLNEDARKQEERAKYGEPSRIVCLINVLASIEEADTETMEDLGEKLKEHGIVERLVPHALYPPAANPSEAVRIFVVFSGPAGAWKALKDLDGRYFAGRQISAKFFDEKRFDRGDWDGPVLQ